MVAFSSKVGLLWEFVQQNSSRSEVWLFDKFQLFLDYWVTPTMLVGLEEYPKFDAWLLGYRTVINRLGFDHVGFIR